MQQIEFQSILDTIDLLTIHVLACKLAADGILYVLPDRVW